MEINLLAVVICAVASVILGTVWYGFLFGKQWEEIVGNKGMTKEKRAELQKKAMPLYGVAFVMSLFQAGMLNQVVTGESEPLVSVYLMILIWIAIIVPILAGSGMWTNDSRRISWMRFGIQSGYYLLLFVIWALILSAF